MRVLLLNQAAWPDVVATAQHLDDLSRHLAATGHDVHVVASRALYGQAGAALPAEEARDGVRLHRVAGSAFGKRGLVARAFDFAAFHAAAFLRALRLPRPDVVVSLSTPPFLVATSLLLARLRGAALVYWVMDLYPDVPVALGVLSPRSLSVRALERLHRAALCRAERVVVLGRCMERLVLDKGVRPERLALVRPWADAAELRPGDGERFRREHGLLGAFVVMYSGNLGLGHDTATMASAAARLAERDDVRFVLVGSGKGRAEALAAFTAAGARPPLALPYQPREALAETLAAADVHLVTLREGAAGVMVPSKLFGILAAARPVVHVGPAEGEVARLVEELGCGANVRCGDAGGLATALARLADDRELARAQGARGRAALESRFDRPLACRRLAELLDEAAAERRRGAAPG